MAENGHKPLAREELRTEFRKYVTKVDLKRELKKYAKQETVESKATREDLTLIQDTLDSLLATYHVCRNKPTVHDQRIPALEQR